MAALAQPQRHTRPAMWQSLAAQWQICEGSMNYLWQALALFAGFINSSGGYISKVPTNTVEKHVLWHLSTHLIGNLGLQDCWMHLHSQVSSIIHRKCKNYGTRSSSPSKMVKAGSQMHTRAIFSFTSTLNLLSQQHSIFNNHHPSWWSSNAAWENSFQNV